MDTQNPQPQQQQQPTQPQLQEGKLDVNDPSLNIPNVAPTEGLADEVVAARDPETAIYGNSATLGNRTLEGHVYAMDTAGGLDDGLGDVGKTVKGVAAGAGDLGASLGQLAAWGYSQAKNRIFGTQDRTPEVELPQWLQPNDDYERLISGATQFGAAFTGLGELANVAKIHKVIEGAQAATEALPFVSKLANTGRELSEEFPAISKLAQDVSSGLSLGGKTAAVDFAAFKGQTGNLANAIQDATKDHPGLVHDISHALAVHKEDDEGFARLKNTIVGKVGEATGAALFSSVKVLKTMHSISEGLQRDGGKLTAELKTQFQQLHTNTEEFKAEVEKIKGQDDPQLLQDLFQPPAAIHQENPNTTISAHVSQGEDGTIHVEATPGDGSSGGGAAGGGGSHAPENPTVEVINPGDHVSDAAAKSVNAYKQTDSKGNRMARKMQGINQLLKAQAEQAGKSFNRYDFVRSIQSKLAAGMPVDIQQELANSLGGGDLEDIDHFLKTWKEVVTATVSEVKRYVSNNVQKSRLKSVLAVGLGKDLTYDSALDSAFTKMIEGGKQSLTGVEDAALDRLGLNLLHQHVLAPQLGKLYNAAFDAEVVGDTGALQQLEGEIKRILPMYTQAKTLDKAILSEFGRGLQTAKIDQTSKEAADFMTAVQKAKRDTPLLKDSDLATPTGRQVVSAAMKDIHNNTDWSNMNAYAKFGHQTAQVLDATVTGMHKLGAFTVGAWSQLFYNNILNSAETARNIFYHNHIIKSFDLAGDAVGGTVHAADTLLSGGSSQQAMEPLLRTRDELVGYAQYFMDGFRGALSTLKTGTNHPFDYAHAHPGAISSEGLRSHFGKSIGDALQDAGLIQNGSMADWAIDKTQHVGGLMMWPMTHLIGGIDTSFKVSNQMQMVRTELASYGRTVKGMSDRDALTFANDNTKQLVEDLIVARSHNFSSNSPIQNQHFDVDQLSTLNSKLVNNTNTVMMKHDLNNSQLSDRWLFRIGASGQDITRNIPVLGPAAAPFIKTFVNAMQYGVDSFPGSQFLSPYNHSIMNGEMGVQAKNNLLGRQILGAVFAAGGIGAANSGLLAPPQGSFQARKNDKELTGGDAYSLRFNNPNLPDSNPLSGPVKLLFPNGNKSAVTFNFSRLGPVPTLFFLPGQLYQLGTEAYNRTIDPSAFVVAGVGTTTQMFGSGQLLRGLSTSFDSFSNTSYSTGDNFYRNMVSLTGSGLVPGGRINDSLSRYTDPYYRDFKTNSGNLVDDYKSYVTSRLPGMSNKAAPVYDAFGNKRPRDDYVGDTNTLATNLTRIVTPLGIKYTSNDPLSQELERFGKLGQAIIPPGKNQSYKGTTVPLDQFVNPKTGESLWDAYNKEFSSLAIPADDGSGKQVNLRDYLNSLIQSKEYQHDMSDNQISRSTGRRQVMLGSRWATINKTYQLGKEEISNPKTGVIWNKPEYQTEYQNKNGQTLENVLETVNNERAGLK